MRLELIESLKTGHFDIDEDHAKIIAAINDISNVARNSDGLKQMPSMLERFIHICEAHFDKEENILSQANYPRLNEHSAYHRQLLVNANAARRRFDTAQSQESRLRHIEDMIEFLVDDILGSDMTFVSFLQARGLARDRT